MDDEYVTMAQTVMEGFGKATVPGAYWVEYLPIFKHIPSWVPGTAARKLAEYYAPYVTTVRMKPYQDVKQAVVSDRRHHQVRFHNNWI